MNTRPIEVAKDGAAPLYEHALRGRACGLDIASELADLARRRLPAWADRIWTGNALSWEPPRRFDLVRTGLEYVPPPRRREYVARLLARVGGRLIVGTTNDERSRPRLVYSVFWIDGANR